MNEFFLPIALFVIRSGTLSGTTPFMANDVAVKITLQGRVCVCSCFMSCQPLVACYYPQRMPAWQTIREARIPPFFPRLLDLHYGWQLLSFVWLTSLSSGMNG